MKLQILISFLFLTQNLISAQSTTNVCGGVYATTYGSTSFSFGEVFYTTKGDKNTLSEGIQFGYTLNPIVTTSSLHIVSYPNPTTDFVFFKVENLNYTDLFYVLYDASGNFIKNGSITDARSFVSLKNLPSEIYILRCNRGNKEFNYFKIFKID